MLLRITRTDQNGTVVLRVEGGLSAGFVAELAKQCDSLDGAVLELDNLRCVDAAGTALLAELACRGFQLRGVSHYIALRIRHCDVSKPPASSSVA